MKRFMNKKMLVVGVAVAVLLGVGGAAFAFYSSTGSGTGSAQAGSVKALTISQIGPGYDSLVTGNGYVQDQCFACQGLTEFGNAVNLSTTGILSNVVVAMRNWGGVISGLPITLSFYSPVTSPETPGGVSPTPFTGNLIIQDTQDFNFAAAISPSEPSVSNITFDFSSQDFPLPSPVVYGISFDSSTFGSGGLNVALSNAATQNTVGSDVYPGYVYADSTTGGLTGDAGSCASEPDNSFQLVEVWCNDTPLDNWGAYGNSTGADIPAVEINVVGGTTPPLYPGDTQEVDFAITNPNPGSVYVNTVTIALNVYGGDAATPLGADIANCQSDWFTLGGSPVALDQNVPTGLTQFEGVANIHMINEPYPQNACAGAIIGLNFTSN
jgi:hypothetical protein